MAGRAGDRGGLWLDLDGLCRCGARGGSQERGRQGEPCGGGDEDAAAELVVFRRALNSTFQVQRPGAAPVVIPFGKGTDEPLLGGSDSITQAGLDDEDTEGSTE